MMSLSLFLAVAIPHPQTAAPAKYMAPASYYALSPVNDPQAAGGYGTSGQLPRRVGEQGRRPHKLQIVLRQTLKEGLLTVEILNLSGKDEWLEASDSNLRAYIEAKDAKGEWRHIQYHFWATCGNSRHRVLLPASHFWRFTMAMPKGSFKTKLRVVLKNDKEEVLSNEIEALIPTERFSLSPEVAKTNRVHTDWGVPTLVPKDMK